MFVYRCKKYSSILNFSSLCQSYALIPSLLSTSLYLLSLVTSCMKIYCVRIDENNILAFFIFSYLTQALIPSILSTSPYLISHFTFILLCLNSSRPLILLHILTFLSINKYTELSSIYRLLRERVCSFLVIDKGCVIHTCVTGLA